jgi:hypothetical protein
MALTRIGDNLDYLADGNDVISKTISKRYSSEVEVLNGSGELADVIYSGAETTETETSIGETFQELGANGNGATIRSRVEVSNEDVARTTNEKLTFDF